MQSLNSTERRSSQKQVSELTLEYKIEGMTCVSCSKAIENGMENEFRNKGLIKAQIALLTHKMRIVFNAEIYNANQLNPDIIKEEVEMIGFNAELL